MANSRWDEIQTLFLKALDCAPEAREQLLDREAPDAAVRAEVEAMLRANETTADLRALERLPLTASRGPMAAGERIGRYELLELVGTGGMGEVYRARRVDDQYRQEVALKVLRGDLALPALADRFRRERQILAELQHPNVTTLLDGGATEDGRPYLVMQFESGLPMTTYADEHGLTVQQRLELFVTVCEAVQYAHANLVVHRDLKPSNVLVDQRGQPKLLDFGIAKIIEEGVGDVAQQTRELRMLTPEYAAPEQISGGAITTGTDVYALGILLYELLVGEPPFRMGTLTPLDFHRKVLEERPTRPSEGVRASLEAADPSQATDVAALRGVGAAKLFQSLTGDLDQIVLTALRKEPGRRYPSADALAEDVRRYLAGHAIWAQPPSRRYRLKKFVSRHRVGVGAAAAFVVLLSTFAGTMAVQSARVVAERDRAEVALARAEEVGEFLVGLFKAANPREEPDQLSAIDLLARGAERAGELAEQPEVQADMLTAVGTAYVNLGQFDPAEPVLERALELRRGLFGTEHADVAGSLSALALLYGERGDYDSAQARYEDVLEIRQALDGPGSVEAAKVLSSLGVLRTRKGEIDEAIPLFEDALDRFGQLPFEEMAVDARDDYANALNNLGLTLVQKGDPAAGEPYLEEALAMNRTLLPDNHPTIATNLNNLATVRFRQDKLDEAERGFLEVLERRRALYGDDHPDVGAPLNNLSMVKRRQGEFERAEAYLLEALAIQRRTQGPEHPLLGLSLKNLGRLLVEQEKFAEAEPVALESLSIFRSRFGDDHRQVGLVRQLLVEVYAGLGRPEDAARYADPG